ncbi:MAG: M48 family peptidase [Gammaproteobacteria bacterium]|nr:MAG: M48 family peptidase [Gammaproteobacteria bacterium]
MRLPALLLACCLLLPLGGAAETALPEMGAPSQQVLSPRRAAAIGAEVYRRLRREGRLLEDLPALRYLDHLGNALVAASDDPAGHFRFFLVRDRTLNAFALPGGFIGVHLGLFEATEDESELAAVLAHEIAHVTQHHLARAYAQASHLSIPTLAAVLAAVLVGTQNSEAGQAILMGTQAGALQRQINYTRSNEAEADHIGMRILQRAGFDPRGMPRFFGRLQRQSRLYGAGPPPLLRTHPVTTARIADALARIPPDLDTRHLRRDSLRFQLVRARLQALHAPLEQADPERFRDGTGTGPASPRVLAHRYGRALALGRRKRFRPAIALLQALARRHPEQPLFAFDLARLQQQAGDLEGARATLRRGLQVQPGNVLLVLQSARLDLEAGRARRAATRLAHRLEVGPRLGFATRQACLETLAHAYQAAGDRLRAHETLARRHEEAGELAAAIDQLEQALRHARTDTARGRIQAHLHDLRLRQHGGAAGE